MGFLCNHTINNTMCVSCASATHIKAAKILFLLDLVNSFSNLNTTNLNIIDLTLTLNLNRAVRHLHIREGACS